MLTPNTPQVGKTGPGQYSPDEIPSRSMVAKVKNKVHGRNGKFGTISERFPQKRLDCSRELGAGIQQKVELVPRSLVPQPQEKKAAFQVGEARLPKSKALSESALFPCPGSYEDIDLQKVNYRSKLARPANEHFGFGCGQDRFREVAAGVRPDPGAYDPILATRCAGGMVKSTGGRSPVQNFPATVDLGPGAYDVNPAWLRKSFNVSHAAHAKSVLAAVSVASCSTSQMLAIADDGSSQQLCQHTSSSTSWPLDREEESLQLPEHHVSLVHLLEHRAEAARKRCTARIPRLKPEGVIVS